MLVRGAEESFERGMTALDQGHDRVAMAFFEAAIELEKRAGVPKPQARYLSYYGLCLAIVTDRKHEGAKFCKEAVDLEAYNPDLLCNLARVLLAADRRKDAHKALMRGLRLQPDHVGIIQQLRRMGIRKRPPLPILDRSNPVNVFLGKMRNGAR
jgi:predicted Zn-dependent protease